MRKDMVPGGWRHIEGGRDIIARGACCDRRGDRGSGPRGQPGIEHIKCLRRLRRNQEPNCRRIRIFDHCARDERGRQIGGVCFFVAGVRSAIVGGDGYRYRCCVAWYRPAACIQLLDAHLYRIKAWRGALIWVRANADAKGITARINKFRGRYVLVQCRTEIVRAVRRAAQLQITDPYAATQRIPERLRKSVRRGNATKFFPRTDRRYEMRVRQYIDVWYWPDRN